MDPLCVTGTEAAFISVVSRPWLSQLSMGGFIFAFSPSSKCFSELLLKPHSFHFFLSQSWWCDEDHVSREAAERNAYSAEPDRRPAGFWGEWHLLIGDSVTLQGVPTLPSRYKLNSYVLHLGHIQMDEISIRFCIRWWLDGWRWFSCCGQSLYKHKKTHTKRH